MATKRKTKRTTKSRTTASRAKSRSRKKMPLLSPEAKGEIFGVVLAVLAVLLIFADFNFGGTLVIGLFHDLKVVFGNAALVLPIIFAVLAWRLFQPAKYQVRAWHYLALAVFMAAFSGLWQLSVDPANGMVLAKAGEGGGMLGYSIANMMLPVINKAASIIVLLALMLISLIVASGIKLSELFGGLGSIFKREPKDEVLTVNDATAIGVVPELKVNDNSGAPVLPIRGTIGGAAEPMPKPVMKEEAKEALTTGVDVDWKKPEMTLLSQASSKADAGDVKANAAIIKSTLDSFNIAVQMGEVNVGPTVTQYTFTPPSGVKLNKITTLDTNLALSLAAHPIRIEAPIPGKSAVGVEIPNKSIATVRLRSVLETPEWKKEDGPLTFVLGRDVSGIPMFTDLAKMPHMLIAGATGSGKSAMINSFLTSLLFRNSPNDLKLILVDPKRVELGLYNGIPHLLAEVINDPEKAISALKWAVAEMERRYKLLADVGNRNIIEYNKAHPDDRLPYIVVVIDEMADLMIVAAKDVETLIVRLAQMARAIGIHLVLATQRPSVDVITGVIKANVPARLAFSVASQIDSRTILDQMGAEKLLGKGDMLFASPEMMKPRRIQGAFLEESEVKAVTDFLREQTPTDFAYNDDVLAQKVNIGGRSSGGGGGGDGEIDDDLFAEAADAVIRAGKASTSMLQRRLRVGYARAARLIDLLEEQGVVGPADGARPRDVLVSSIDQVRGAGGPSSVEEMRPAEPYDD
ncbi:DNA translocase FtsK 4TM domain-containing protein [Candidatus Saccharibacteria bacterium]|nr:DNA translocase FtsK 4TM domain-containing protein [Candidatus Saccharibacteria bacterium]